MIVDEETDGKKGAERCQNDSREYFWFRKTFCQCQSEVNFYNLYTVLTQLKLKYFYNIQVNPDYQQS